jgi:hypothetical protein
VDDWAEENDDLESAVTVGWDPVESLVACDEDLDFFQFTVTQTDTLYLGVFFEHDAGDIDIAILDGEGFSLGSGASSTDNEFVEATLDPGTYFVEVGLYPGDEAQGNAYSLDVNVGTPLDCPTDPLEPNDSQATASMPAMGVNDGLHICPLDADYYSVSGSNGETIDVALSFEHLEGDIDLRLLNASGETLAYSNSQSNNESVSFTLNESADLTVMVSLWSESGSESGNPYSMTVSSISP